MVAATRPHPFGIFFDRNCFPPKHELDGVLFKGSVGPNESVEPQRDSTFGSTDSPFPLLWPKECLQLSTRARSYFCLGGA